MKYQYSLFFLVICSLAISACSNPTEPLDRDPFIVGFITEIEQHRILVEENVSVNEPLDYAGNKIYFSIDDKTKIYAQLSDGTLQKIAFTDLRAGDKVKGWAKGGIADSYPHQGLAGQIVLIERK